MAHWFHRNPLKSTTAVKFDVKMVAAEPEAIRICSELRRLRGQLIDLLCDANSAIDVVNPILTEYLSLLLGLIHAQDDRGGDSSKLRHHIRFKWTNSVLGTVPTVQQDAVFELLSMCEEYGIWLMKHVSMISAKDEIKMEEAKQIHICLRKAGGVFTYVQSADLVDKLLSKPEPGSDFDPRVLNAYILQCTGEAQEVTIARAMELKHSASLISGLSAETAKTFIAGASAIKALDAVKFMKWMRYFQLKSAIYEALAYCYFAENLLALEKCGEAIKAMEESERYYTAAEKLIKEYSKIKASGTNAKPDEHLFFRKLLPLINRTKEKCLRENGMIFHQRVPADVPVLDYKATHGLVDPEPFALPPLSQMWTPTAYKAFDLSKNINPKDPANSAAATAAEGPLPEMKEKTIHQTQKDPKNQSGCTLQ